MLICKSKAVWLDDSSFWFLISGIPLKNSFVFIKATKTLAPANVSNGQSLNFDLICSWILLEKSVVVCCSYANRLSFRTDKKRKKTNHMCFFIATTNVNIAQVERIFFYKFKNRVTMDVRFREVFMNILLKCLSDQYVILIQTSLLTVSLFFFTPLLWFLQLINSSYVRCCLFSFYICFGNVSYSVSTNQNKHSINCIL